MAEFQGISFSMTTSASTPTEAERFAFDPCTAFQLPDGAVLAKSKRSGNRVILPADVFSFMQNCQTYTPIEEHLDYLVSIEPGLAESREQLQQVFKDIDAQGLMDSATRKISALKVQGAQAVQAEFAGVFIRTCDRPQQLQRLLNSLLEQQQQFAHQYHYTVADDSAESESQQQNEEICSAIQQQGLAVSYYGLEKQQVFQQTLSTAFPDNAEAIRWLLTSNSELAPSTFTGGRLLNHIILRSAGKRFALMDDDAVCQPYHSLNAKHQWNFKPQPRETAFFENREQLFATIQPAELDPLTQHQDLIGKTFGQVCSELSAVKLDAQALQDVSAEDGLNLTADTPILVTRNGTFGDPGTASMTWIYQQSEQSLQALTADQARYTNYFSNRTSWIGSANFRAVNESALMTTTLTGFDGSQLLPPTGPFFRNEDYLFSRLLKFLHPNSLILEFPWGLPHLPEPPRHWHQAKLDTPKTVGILGFMADIAANVERFCLADSPQQRLRYLATTYQSLADAKTGALAEGVEENLLNARTATINTMQGLLRLESMPGFCRTDIQRIVAANSNGLGNPEQQLFPDAGAGETRQQQVVTCQHVLANYAESLSIWADLWEHCKNAEY